MIKALIKLFTDKFDGKKTPAASVHVYSEENAIDALKKLVFLTSKEEFENNRSMTLVVGNDDPVVLRIISNARNCECTQKVTLDVLAFSQAVIDNIKHEFADYNKDSGIVTGNLKKVDYEANSFIVAPSGYYFQSGPNFSYAEAVFKKDNITDLLLKRVEEIRSLINDK